MKAYLLLLLVFCLNLNGKQERCIRCVTIYKVDIDIETVINVSPYSFSSAFAGNIDTLKKSVFFYDILRHNLNKKYLSKNASSLDTRYIIKVEYNQGLEDIIYGDRFYILFENKYYQRFTPFDNTEHGNFLDLNIFERTMVYYSVHTHPRNGYPGASDHLLSNLFLLKGRVYGWNGVQYDYYRDKDFW